MSYTLNISFIFTETLESQFSLWCKNNALIENYSIFRVIGSNEGALTYCAQIEKETLSEVQKTISFLNQELFTALKKDFNEEIVYFMSALERL